MLDTARPIDHSNFVRELHCSAGQNNVYLHFEVPSLLLTATNLGNYSQAEFNKV